MSSHLFFFLAHFEYFTLFEEIREFEQNQDNLEIIFFFIKWCVTDLLETKVQQAISYKYFATKFSTIKHTFGAKKNFKKSKRWQDRKKYLFHHRN